MSWIPPQLRILRIGLPIVFVVMTVQGIWDYVHGEHGIAFFWFGLAALVPVTIALGYVARPIARRRTEARKTIEVQADASRALRG